MIKIDKDDIFEIKDKKIYSIHTSMGLSTRTVYRFWVKEFKQSRMGIIITMFKNIAKIRCSEIDKFDNLIDSDVILLPKNDEVEKILYTELWCIEDFKKEHPEVRKFIYQ